jgi:uncharacterized membrane protein YoaK (UPF0700 family)
MSRARRGVTLVGMPMTTRHKQRMALLHRWCHVTAGASITWCRARHEPKRVAFAADLASLDRDDAAATPLERSVARMTSSRRDALLACLAFSSGTLDAVCVLALGKVFAAFMTGNVVFLGVRAAGAEGPNAVRVAIALGMFAAGVAIAVRHAHSEGDQLWPRRVTNVLLGVAGLEVVFLALWLSVGGHPDFTEQHALVSIAALAMGMQSGAVLALNVPGVFTTAATATIVRLVGDFAGGAPLPIDRVRLLAVLVGILVGAGAGAALYTHATIVAPVLAPLATLGVCGVALLRGDRTIV